ncbi:hypothetical protein CCM_02780 [Cordyceps militaris CM01]|uniref:Uncharacterized protein n=1 Tax=Cordyceps militaris (strain CM01) TaxID=983644 RepID=G3JBT6_CORMM|nr:uncharacterized protein CCM_02780 [Cordyceps militaris CM01]EGX94509.1 hypothetical protein CCM_02780 [Cordyceps militaris CM01]
MPDWQDDPAPFGNLRPPAIEALAGILYLKHATTTGSAPSKTEAACASWLHQQKRAVAHLDDISLRRPRTLSLLGDVFFFSSARHGSSSSTAAAVHETLQADAAAALCPSHKRLNPRVLAALLALVADEATRRLDRVRAALQQQQQQQQQQRGDEAAVELWLRSASRIAALWMGKRRWEETMRRPLDVGLPPCARYGRCAACKLAVIGGSPQFLMDLRTSLVARHEHACRSSAAAGARAPPPLLRMVEAWIDVCYPRHRRQHIRRESDLMAGAVLRLRLGGSVAKKSCAPSSRRTLRAAWPARISLLVEADVEELLGSGSDGDEDGGELVVEYAPGCRQRCKRSTPAKEGYSQYLPASAFMGPERSSAAARRPGEQSKPQQQQQPSRSTNRAKTNVPRATAASSPPPPAPPPVRTSVHNEASTTNMAEPPWATADYDPPALAKPSSSPSLASTSAELAAIYDAYRGSSGGGDTASLGSPAASLFTRGMPAAAAAAPGTVSPPTPSEFSSNPMENAAPTQPNDGGNDDASLRPPPLRTRPRSGIPVPVRMAAGRTPVPPRDSVQSMTSTILLGYGLCRRRRAAL